MTGRPAERTLEATTRPDEVETWIFDLDNTLYATTPGISADTNRLMGAFVADFLAVEPDEARRIQKTYFREFGLTLRGLMVNHGLDPAVYRDHMMQVDLSEIGPAPELGAALARLPGRRIVYTNAFGRHAEEVLERLGVAELFEVVHDIESAEFLPKPAHAAYADMCRRHDIAPERAVMIDDIAHNLAPAAALGMATVWLRTGAEWAPSLAAPDYVDHIIEDVLSWLRSLVGDG